jgi:fucose permease
MNKRFIYALLVKTTKDMDMLLLKTSAELVFNTMVHLTQGPVEAMMMLSLVQLKIAEKFINTMQCSINKLPPDVINEQDVVSLLTIVHAYTLLLRDEPDLIAELEEKMNEKEVE